MAGCLRLTVFDQESIGRLGSRGMPRPATIPSSDKTNPAAKMRATMETPAESCDHNIGWQRLHKERGTNHLIESTGGLAGSANPTESETKTITGPKYSICHLLKTISRDPF